GPKHREQIDTAMLVVAAILVGEQHRDIARVDVLHVHRQPPSALGRGERPQKIAIPAEDGDGKLLGHFKWWRPDGTFRESNCSVDGKPQRNRKTERRHEPAPRPSCPPENCAPEAHCFAKTTSLPCAVRANRSGWYMSSTVAAGCT